ncbi:hypothetical protein [Latilactobacillus sakei]
MRKLQDLANDDEFEQAHHIIQQIHSNELAEPEDFKRYYYYQGRLAYYYKIVRMMHSFSSTGLMNNM